MLTYVIDQRREMSCWLHMNEYVRQVAGSGDKTLSQRCATVIEFKGFSSLLPLPSPPSLLSPPLHLSPYFCDILLIYFLQQAVKNAVTTMDGHQKELDSIELFVSLPLCFSFFFPSILSSFLLPSSSSSSSFVHLIFSLQVKPDHSAL